jgi:hypothetical protein
MDFEPVMLNISVKDGEALGTEQFQQLRSPSSQVFLNDFSIFRAFF